jgi:5-methylthioadenosine/S-adenosylhomocysteine deaminase
MERIIIKNCQYLAYKNKDLTVEKGDILISGNIIEKTGENIDSAGARVIDGNNTFVMPGLVNTHTHAAMNLLRSYADDMELKPWLEEKIWPAEENLRGEHVYWGSMLAFLEMIKSGTTTFADMYFFMDDVAKAAVEIGIRGVLARGLIQFTDPDGKNLQENIELVKKYHKKDDGRITCLIGPHAPYTTSPEYLKKVMEAADENGVGLHIHISETKQEVEDIYKEHGVSPVEYLESLGLFQRHVVAAHCVHVSEKDMDILKKYNVGVCHNPGSNLKLASGIAPVPAMLEKGINVGIGTDGASSNNNLNMFEEMHLTALIHKGYNLNPLILNAREVLEMATIGGARVLGLENEIGSLEEGKKADIIIVDLEKPHLYPKADLISNMVYSAQASDVKTVIINGRIVMENYKLTTYDEKEILIKSDEMKNDLL